jgi:Ca2+/Na+ antiporter
MALGSSAPEILLSVIQTTKDLEDIPPELGASTIVGSAAFNLLVISAVSILAVE